MSIPIFSWSGNTNVRSIRMYGSHCCHGDPFDAAITEIYIRVNISTTGHGTIIYKLSIPTCQWSKDRFNDKVHLSREIVLL